MNRLIAAAVPAALGLAFAVYAQKSPATAGEMPMKQGEMPMAHTNGSLRIVSPRDGETVTTTDIPVKVAVKNFNLSAAHVGMPDVDGEGHVHVMLDGMNMGVLFNFYTAPQFTLPGRGVKPGPHTLIFDLASNTHMDFENTVQKVNINYQPATAEAAPGPAANAGAPAVRITAPADGAVVGPKFAVNVEPANFTPSLGLEGKPNVKGYGHYHVFVDMNMSSADMPGGMMSMAGMIAMPGGNTIPIDLTAWKDGIHHITVEPVQDDHTEIQGAKSATIAINLKGAAGQ